MERGFNLRRKQRGRSMDHTCSLQREINVNGSGVKPK